ncbi:MAG: MBL fold metallo-hydrolase [Deltaproteobacteria bacterium]|nr:MBL fold metallo-hydrolase [Deltaproteobacteria bacterium]
MGGTVHYADVQGITVVFAESHLWPNPANLFVIPDTNGFSMIDVGGGGTSGRDHLHAALETLHLCLEDLHTVVLSHAHPDHMGAMKYVLEAAAPRVYVHTRDVGSCRDPSKLHYSFDIPLAKDVYAQRDQHQDFDLFRFFDDFGCSMCAADEVEGIHEGDILRLGDLAFEVLLTPGHAPGHISLFEKNTGILLPGDLVGISPAWYTPSSGGLTAYLASLDAMESKHASLLIPSHGPVMERASHSIGRIRDKLMKREAILLEALSTGSKTFLELNAALFRDEILHFFPGCGIIESHLIKLEGEDRIERNGLGPIRLR